MKPGLFGFKLLSQPWLQASVQGLPARLNTSLETCRKSLNTSLKTCHVFKLVSKTSDLGLSTSRSAAHRTQISLHRQTPEEEILTRKLRKLLPDLEAKLLPHVRLQPKRCLLVCYGPQDGATADRRDSDTVIKAGTMMILRDSQANEWSKAYFVLRR